MAGLLTSPPDWHTHLAHTTDDALQRLWRNVVEHQRDATAGQGQESTPNPMLPPTPVTMMPFPARSTVKSGMALHSPPRSLRELCCLWHTW